MSLIKLWAIVKLRHVSRLGAGLLLLALCSSCTSSYRYGTQVYRTPSAALAAERADLAEKLAAVQPIEPKIGGTIRIVLPNEGLIRSLGVVTTGRVRENLVEYLVDSINLGLQANVDFVRKSNLFDTVELDRTASAREPDIGTADYLLWFQLTGTGGQWYLRANGVPAKEPVFMDNGSDRLSRGQTWLSSLHNVALQIGSPSAQARSPSPLKPGTISSGSAFVVATKGVVMTNSHVINQCKEITTSRNGRKLSGTVLARDSQSDLALIDFAEPLGPKASFRDGRNIRPGDTVVAVGFPLPGVLASEANVTVGIVSAMAGLRNDSRYLQITAPVQPGNSGGPLLDVSGNVVGIVTAKLDAAAVLRVTGDIPENVNFAVKASLVRSFLETNNIDYATAPSVRELKPADIGDAARGFTIRVECTH